MQVGYVGLLKAINNFDPDIGESLAAYATPCITGEIKRHFRDKRWQVHVRRSAQELRLEIRKARGDLAQQLSRTPTDAELAEHLGVSASDLLDAQRADLAFQASSLSAPLSDGADAGTLEDLLGGDDPQLETRSGYGGRLGAPRRAARPRAAAADDALLRQHDPVRDRRPARHLPDARLPPARARARLPARPDTRNRPGCRRRIRRGPILTRRDTGLAIS